jgi:hypothetical protein
VGKRAPVWLLRFEGEKIWRVRRKRRRPTRKRPPPLVCECVCLLVLSRLACSAGWPTGSVVDLVPNVFCSYGARSGFELLSNWDSRRDSV